MGIPVTLVQKKQLASLQETISKKEQTIERASFFIKEIEKGNLDLQLEAQDDDQLHAALVSMKDQLQKISKEEKERTWVTEGLAKFADILRQHNDDLEELTDHLLRDLADYMGINQAALFVLNTDEEDEPFLEMCACYAYNRKKYLHKRVELGAGMIGQAFLEKEPLYLTEIPEDYVAITSGTGKALPRNIVIIPLKVNDQMYGLIELASFTLIPPYRQQFLERLGESIASTLASVRIAQRTQRLLQESQQQAEMLQAQEEEMRQNMEELSATQEEMARKGTEIEHQIKAIQNSGIASIEFTPDGTILAANESFIQLMGYRLDEIQGKHHRIFMPDDQAHTADYQLFWQELSEGKSKSGEYMRVNRKGERVYLRGSYSAIRDNTGDVVRVLKLATDITAIKAAELDARQQVETLSGKQGQLEQLLEELHEKEHVLMSIMNEIDLPLVALDAHHRLITCNRAFEASFKDSPAACTPGADFLALLDSEAAQQAHRDRMEKVLQGETVKERITPAEGLPLEVTLSPLRNRQNEIVGAISCTKEVSERRPS
ncbi:methyl-accepting chemotaxis protein [Catalinimonas alkaloidigena]|uniref:Methyl-accepting chemotaxis protein n=1 Tax=Catalinimonas alkaloidigena TaxID=1075417 RepID=A0A1G9SIH9_9BACT|nr:PAS domain S-box protein [Catalinimonas alkaloidigena]SDM35308.1 methyl-accepting chemotaxis protein [Catalinimonas alkaloidigena]